MHGRVWEIGWGCWQMCRWVCSTQLHRCEGFSHPKCRSRQQWCHLMMSLISFLCKLRVAIKVSMHRTQGSSVLSFDLSVCFLLLVPPLVHLESHISSNSATSVPLEEWNYNQTGRCSLFVQLYMLKVISGTLSWCAWIATLWVSDPVSEQ